MPSANSLDQARALLERGRAGEARDALAAAMVGGLDGAPCRSLMGFILHQLGDVPGCARELKEAVRLAPDDGAAQFALASISFKLGDEEQAEAATRRAIALGMDDVHSASLLGRILTKQGRLAEAEKAWRAAVRFNPASPQAQRELADLVWMQTGDIATARAKAEIEVDLALGRGEQAVRRAEALRAARPNDQHAIALLATAYRLAGDDRYAALYDYDRLVKSYCIDPPQGWSSVETYLADLGQALDRIHGPLTHPVAQSLRHGSQTMRALADYPDPSIRALFGALDAPIRRHITAIGAEGGYRIASAWSVRLNSGGFHMNHVHPEGWLSSAFYVRVPRAMPGTEGWLKFGEPGPPTLPPLEPDRLVKPQAGMLVLFPSCMWHGTVPFSSDDKRLSCAFDIVRA
jgi:Flp pilus assembly protein TadD